MTRRLRPADQDRDRIMLGPLEKAYMKRSHSKGPCGASENGDWVRRCVTVHDQLQGSCKGYVGMW